MSLKPHAIRLEIAGGGNEPASGHAIRREIMLALPGGRKSRCVCCSTCHAPLSQVITLARPFPESPGFPFTPVACSAGGASAKLLPPVGIPILSPWRNDERSLPHPG